MSTVNHPRRRDAQVGYTLIMVIFLVATIMIVTAAATPSMLSAGRREREQETVWRGEQYERAIGLYYRKFGRYPTKIDDLTKETNGVRFLRKAYTDPMNKQDGTWRFIYVGPNGQLIGSLRSTSLLQNVLSTPTLPGSSAAGSGLGAVLSGAMSPGGATQGASSSPSGGSAGTGTGQNSNGAGSSGPNGAGSNGGGQPGQQTGNFSTSSLADAQPQPLEGEMIGGNIIGVASKIKQSSFLIYFGGDTYQKWEFIWNPMQQVAIPGQTAAPIAPSGVPNGTQTPSSATPGSQTSTNTAPQQQGQPTGDTPPPATPTQ